MELRELKYMMEIGKTKHMSNAANNLYITQPALSKALKKLEEELGVRLFYRDGAQMLPTNACRVLLEDGAAIIRMVEEMTAKITNIEQLEGGVLRVGVPLGNVYALAEIIARFKKRCPKVELELYEGSGAEILQMVVRSELDVAFARRPLESNQVNETLLLADEIVLGVPPQSELAVQETFPIGDLKGKPYICLSESAFIYSDIKEKLVQSGVTTKPYMCGGDLRMLIQVARSSGVPIILPRPTLCFFEADDFLVRPLEPKLKWEACLIYQKNGYLSGAAKLFIGETLETYARIHASYSKRLQNKDAG